VWTRGVGRGAGICSGMRGAVGAVRDDMVIDPVQDWRFVGAAPSMAPPVVCSVGPWVVVEPRPARLPRSEPTIRGSSSFIALGS